jgi:hypothetical protein
MFDPADTCNLGSELMPADVFALWRVVKFFKQQSPNALGKLVMVWFRLAQKLKLIEQSWMNCTISCHPPNGGGISPDLADPAHKVKHARRHLVCPPPIDSSETLVFLYVAIKRIQRNKVVSDDFRVGPRFLLARRIIV